MLEQDAACCAFTCGGLQVGSGKSTVVCSVNLLVRTDHMR